MKINLTNYIVEAKDSLTWGEVERVRSAIYNGVKITPAGMGDIDVSVITEMKYRLLESAVTSIQEISTGKTMKFTRDWMNNLSVEDGEELYSAVENLDKKK